MKDLKALMIPDSQYGGPFSTALTRTFSFFFEPNEAEPNALGWLTQVQDTEDARQKFIRLTEKGIKAYKDVLQIIG